MAIWEKPGCVESTPGNPSPRSGWSGTVSSQVIRFQPTRAELMIVGDHTRLCTNTTLR